MCQVQMDTLSLSDFSDIDFIIDTIVIASFSTILFNTFVYSFVCII